MLATSLGGMLPIGVSPIACATAQTRKVKMATSAKSKVQPVKKSKMDSTRRQLSGGEIELAFRGCVHDGGDAVLIFTVINTTNGDLRCRLGKSDLEALHVVGGNGQVFTDVDCYVDATVVSNQEKTTSFDVKKGERRLISMVVHNVPKSLAHFSDVDMPIHFIGEGEQLFHFDNIEVLSEKTVKAMTR